MLINLARTKAWMDREGVDVLVATSPQNVVYTSGFWSLSHWQHRTTQVYSVLQRDRLDKPAVIMPVYQVDLLESPEHWVADCRPYGKFPVTTNPANPLTGFDRTVAQHVAAEHPKGALDALLAYLKETGAAEATIAIDEGQFADGFREQLAARLPQARIVPAGQGLTWIRMVKTPEELRRIRKVAEINESAIIEAMREAKEGITERALARLYHKALMARDARPAFTVVGFGERAAYPNAIPTDRPLRKGDLIRWDVGCLAHFYYSDLARTYCLGTPPEKAEKYFQAVIAGEKAAIAQMRPGVPVKEVFNAAVEAVRAHGIPHYERHHVGHGVGLNSYDQPLLGAAEDTVLEPGMVFEVETPFYELGWGGVQPEDTVAITETGHELYTSVQTSLSVEELP